MSFDEGYLKNLSLRVGRIRGVEVWLHWVLLFVLALQLLENYLRQIEWPFSSWLVYTATLLLSIFLHEVGHWIAAHLQGGGAEKIILWPLGGLAYCDAPHRPAAQFWVAAGGPIATFILGLLAGAICLAAGWEYFFPILLAEETGFPFFRLAVQYMFLWNAFLGLLNLLPVYPLDGGRMLQSILWARLESHGQASLVTLRVGRVFAILALIGGIMLFFATRRFLQEWPLLEQLRWGLLCAAILHFIEARAARERLVHGGEDEDGIFGYDFSRGYTSLERTATRSAPRRSFLGAVRERRRARALAQRREKERLLRERVDRLLEKISREGMGSLTRAEQRFLERASKALRK
jgi:Zn-dependent protease